MSFQNWPRLFALTALVLASPAWASGFYFGENGTKALLQGGAFAAQADDLTAIQHNPAGLSQLSGFSFLFDSGLLQHEVTFLRKDPGASTSLANPVANGAGLFFLPNAGVGYGLDLVGFPFTLALGVYGPPSVGRYQFPAPNYARDVADSSKYLESPKKYAPQRYALIRNDVMIVYPSLAASIELHPRFSAGASLQYVYSKFNFTQAVYSGISTPASQTAEEPGFDSLVTVDLAGRGGFTGILGVLARPTDSLSIGASVRPPVTVSARGKFIMELGEMARGLNTEVSCPAKSESGSAVVCAEGADLALTLPLELKLGLRWRPMERLGLNLDFVYQGWQSMTDIVLEPREVNIKIGSGEPSAVQTFRIPKRWHKAASLRAGGSFRVSSALTAYAGVMGEEGAALDEYTSVDFLHFSRVFLTGGAGYRFGSVEVLAGAAYTPTVTKEVASSKVLAGSTDPLVAGGVVGAGSYGSGGFIATLGVRGQLGAR